MELFETRIGVDKNHYRMKLYFGIFACLFMSSIGMGCNNTSKFQRHSLKMAIDTVYYTDKLSFSLGHYSYCDFANLDSFNMIPAKVAFSSTMNESTYNVSYLKDKISFIYNFKNGNREIYVNSQQIPICRFIDKNEEFIFDNFNCDYSNDYYYENDNYYLVSSVPSNWTGLITSKVRFVQLIDKKANKCFEFFVDISYCL